MAAKAGDVEMVKAILSAGANPNAINKASKKAMDLSKDGDIKAMLAGNTIFRGYQSNFRERMVAASTGGKTVQQARMEMIQQIESDLPNDVPNLKQFTIELLLANQMFQDRCKESIHQLVEDKHIAVHKYRLLENAAGIKDNETGATFISQLQYLQLENEQQAATIAYFKIQNRMLESSVTQQEEYYRKNLSEMADQHAQEMKIMMDRVQETEQRFLDIQKQISEDLITLRKENQDLKTRQVVNGSLAASPKGDVQLLLNLQNENYTLQQKIKDVQSEKVALNERLKSMEQLKLLHEQEISKARKDMNQLRTEMQQSMTKVLTDARSEADDKDESSGQIIFVRGENGSKQIKGATTEKLVERLTDPGTFDSQFLAAFMLTFRSFMDTNTFLERLIKRFKDTITEAAAGHKDPSQSPVQLRVCNTLKFWIENYFVDFEGAAISEKLMEFIEYIKMHNEKLSSVVSVPLKRKMNDKDGRETIVSSAIADKKPNQPRPKPLIPKVIAKRISNATTAELESRSVSSLNTLKGERPSSISNWGGFNFGKLRVTDEKNEDLKLKLTDLEPLETARQITLIEFELFTAIKPTEFMDQAWMKDDREVRAPNICNMTKWSNHITRWTVTEIVTVKDSVKNRAMIFERFIMLAQHLEKMNNFNGVKEVLAGLQSSAVHRLKRTREAIGAKYLKVYDDMIRLTSSDLNFKTLRSKIYASDPPIIPFPGVYQGDLVFLDTCSRSKLENGLVNFLKYQKIASYILELQVYQQTPYNFEMVVEMCDYVKNYHVFSDDEAYNESLICEPRGS